ncbi:MAG: hypothetical protein DBP02_15890 [gamma proteobacterium symbiont of Ctena orbiculata]|nr:MAG: hypothetical protein DBP02_15890 [gamma proteobacterium symbiont of Ctena orbiculata]
MAIRTGEWEKIGYGGAGKAHYSCSRKYIELDEVDAKISIGSLYYRTGVLRVNYVYVCFLGKHFVDDDTLKRILLSKFTFSVNAYEEVREIDVGEVKLKALVVGCSELTFFSWLKNSGCTDKIEVENIVQKLSS